MHVETRKMLILGEIWRLRHLQIFNICAEQKGWEISAKMSQLRLVL